MDSLTLVSETKTCRLRHNDLIWWLWFWKDRKKWVQKFFKIREPPLEYSAKISKVFKLMLSALGSESDLRFSTSYDCFPGKRLMDLHREISYFSLDNINSILRPVLKASIAIKCHKQTLHCCDKARNLNENPLLQSLL